MRPSIFLVFSGGEGNFWGAYSTRKNANEFVASGWAKAPKESMRVEEHILDKLLGEVAK